MSVVGINAQEQQDVLQLVAAILHLSNITFSEDRSNTASIQDDRCNSVINLKLNLKLLLLFFGI